MVDTTSSETESREVDLDSDRAFSGELRSNVLRALDDSVDYDDATLSRMQVIRRQALESTKAGARVKNNSSTLELIWARRSAFALALMLGVATLFILDDLDSNSTHGGDGVLYSDSGSRKDALNGQELFASQADPSSVAESEAVDVIGGDADLPVEEQIALFADDVLELDFYESLAFYEWLESREV